MTDKTQETQNGKAGAAGTDSLSVTDNRINGALQCKENSPAPTGSGNVAQGGKEGQCARL